MPLRHDEVIVVDYDPAWPARYEKERVRIARALRHVVVAIEHVGSTAVPGLAAKPIIDIMVGVREQADGERCIQPLEAIGYEYRGEGEIPGWRHFRRGDPRSHHLHLVEQHSDFWKGHIRFRDLLREDADVARQYGALKRELAVTFRTQRLDYTEAKTPFIEAAMARAQERHRP